MTIYKRLADAWKHYENVSDKGHGVNHIREVRDNALEIANEYKYEVDTAEVIYASILHDICREDDLINGTNNHEITGAEEFKKYTSHMSKESQERIANAIRNHRHSTGEPKDALSKVIYDADRVPRSLEYKLKRPFYYRIALGYTPDEALIDAYDYCKEKLPLKLDENKVYSETAKTRIREYKEFLESMGFTLEYYRKVIME